VEVMVHVIGSRGMAGTMAGQEEEVLGNGFTYTI
jgi:hypothetical protein